MRMSKRKLSGNGLVVVVGCGRLGANIANALSRQGRSVVVVDARPEAFAELSGEFSGFTVEADATEYAVLAEAGIDKAEALLACTDDDAVNLLVAQVARDVFKVPRVAVRTYDPHNSRLCQALGLKNVCQSTIIGDLMLQAIDAREEE